MSKSSYTHEEIVQNLDQISYDKHNDMFTNNEGEEISPYEILNLLQEKLQDTEVAMYVSDSEIFIYTVLSDIISKLKHIDENDICGESCDVICIGYYCVTQKVYEMANSKL